MKKRFKNWLIKKAGGYTKEEVAYILSDAPPKIVGGGIILPNGFSIVSLGGWSPKHINCRHVIKMEERK